jgi:hypothetical protein
LKEFLRVLSKDGVLVFQLPSKLRDQPPGTLSASQAALKEVQTFNADQPVMEMHGVEKSEVIQLLNEHGGRVAHLAEDLSLGPAWESFRYFVVKDPAPAF